ncbi:MAG: zinc dependent phospholipase C family protein [Candidatus Bathyarchaeia archaeon]
MRRAALISALVAILLVPQISLAGAWSNGGYSADTSNPDYGTHDWIAQHALDWLPTERKQYITDNLQLYLYGTELPDRPVSQGGIGDTTRHHIYYWTGGALQDEAAAIRAQAEYTLALTSLEQGDEANAALHAGAMAHYITDMGVYSHVMGASTDWGAETHHSDYENNVNSDTATYSATFVKPFEFDGSLDQLDAATAARQLAYDTTFDGGDAYNATWMDSNYNWTTIAFKERSWESINLAANKIADVLNTLYTETTPAELVATTITCNLSSGEINQGGSITISGTISASVSATVTIEKSQDQGTTWTGITTVTSNSGAYTYQWSPSQGTYQIRASWPGDSIHLGAASASTTLKVNQGIPGYSIGAILIGLSISILLIINRRNKIINTR